MGHINHIESEEAKEKKKGGKKKEKNMGKTAENIKKKIHSFCGSFNLFIIG